MIVQQLYFKHNFKIIRYIFKRGLVIQQFLIILSEKKTRKSSNIMTGITFKNKLLSYFTLKKIYSQYTQN